jgi:hypothetical protein
MTSTPILVGTVVASALAIAMEMMAKVVFMMDD